MSKPNRLSSILVGLLVFIQLLDIAVHVMVDQVEPLRVSSNLIILLWLTYSALRRFPKELYSLSITAVGVYLVLNLIFLALFGITNPEQGDALRIPLFAFVGITVCLGILIINKKKI